MFQELRSIRSLSSRYPGHCTNRRRPWTHRNREQGGTEMKSILIATAVIVLLSSILITPNAYYFVVKRILGCQVTSLLRCIALPSVGTALMCLVAGGVLLMFETSLLALTASVVTGLLIYVGATLLLERSTGLKAWSNLAEVLRDLSK